MTQHLSLFLILIQWLKTTSAKGFLCRMSDIPKIFDTKKGHKQHYN